MKLPSLCSIVLVELVSAQKPCPLLGQQYPQPVQIASEPRFQAAVKVLEGGLKQKSSNGTFNKLSFSLGMFSTSEDNLLWEYHHTSAGVANSTYGVQEVDADSIYRIGSISKLLTIYLWLISDGDRRWNHPITDYLPGLLEVSNSGNGVTPDWESITVGDLAGQMAGLNRDFGLADMGQPENALVQIPKAFTAAFPELPDEQIPSCGYLNGNATYVVCSDEGKHISELSLNMGG